MERIAGTNCRGADTLHEKHRTENSSLSRAAAKQSRLLSGTLDTTAGYAGLYRCRRTAQQTNRETHHRHFKQIVIYGFRIRVVFHHGSMYRKQHPAQSYRPERQYLFPL